MDVSAEGRRQAYNYWLRTGRWPVPRMPDGIELKFNPYHDPSNGQFTFAPGGGTSALGARYARSGARRPAGPVTGTGGRKNGLPSSPDGEVSTQAAGLAGPPIGPRPLAGRGSNSRAFEDPMTLEQSFPGLRGSPGGAVVAVADNLFDLTGPANAMTAEVLQNEARKLVSEIKAVDTTWHYDEIVPTDAFGNPIHTVQSLSAKVNDLRFQRAAVIARKRGNYEPLQVETLRLMQRRADKAYDRGVALLKAGQITPRLSDQEALGNYVDQQVRKTLRESYNQVGINSAGAGPVRVNRRENISSGSDLTYRRPDARVKDVAYDVTLTRKTLSTPQVRGFFEADFRPSRVVIIRPRQLGVEHAYAIQRPETKR